MLGTSPKLWKFFCVRTEFGAGGHLVALPGGGCRVLRRRSSLVPQSGSQQGPARNGHGDLQTSVPGEGKDENELWTDKEFFFVKQMNILNIDIYSSHEASIIFRLRHN